MKDIIFSAEFNSYTGSPRNDGDIVKLNFVTSAAIKEGPKLLAAFGKTVDIFFAREGQEEEMGGTVAEFKKFTASPKTDGSILRISFVVRAHDPILLKLFPEQGEQIDVRVSPDGGQTVLFPEAEDEDLEESNDEEDGQAVMGLKLEP